MKKKTIIFIIILLVIIAVIFGIKKTNNAKTYYEITEVKSFEFFGYYESNKYGVIDKDGNILVEAKYKKIIIPNPEKDIFVCYNENDDTTILNSKGNELFTEYSNVEPIKLKNVASILCYEKSVLKYKKDGLYGLIDFNGKKLTKNIYDSIENLQSTEGKLLVSKKDKYGVINIKGTTLVKTNYDSVMTDGSYVDNNYIKSGFIVSITTDDGYKYGYIDYKGKEIIKPEFNVITRIAELDELYLVISKNGKYGAYKGSKKIIPHEYQSIIFDESGMLLLEKNKNYGMSNLEGDVKIPVSYTNIETKGIYIYASNPKDNIVYDNQGNKIDMNFNKSIYNTENEEYRITTVINNDIMYYGIENKKGIPLIKESYSYIEYAYKDYFIARDDKGNLGVINSNGKVLIDFKYDLLQKIKGKNMIQILNEKNDKTYIYSSELKPICEMKNATIDNQQEFIKVFNNKKEKYFDNEGNNISKDSDIIKSTESKTIPLKIKEYKKMQYSLDNVFYMK